MSKTMVTVSDTKLKLYITSIWRLHRLDQVLSYTDVNTKGLSRRRLFLRWDTVRVLEESRVEGRVQLSPGIHLSTDSEKDRSSPVVK